MNTIWTHAAWNQKVRSCAARKKQKFGRGSKGAGLSTTIMGTPPRRTNAESGIKVGLFAVSKKCCLTLYKDFPSSQERFLGNLVFLPEGVRG